MDVRSLHKFIGGELDRSPVTALATTGTVTIDCSLGNIFTLTPTGNVTLAFSNAPPSAIGQTIMLKWTQSATARTLTFPSAVKWAGGTSLVVSTGSGAVDVIAFTTFDGGTSWQASGAKAFA